MMKNFLTTALIALMAAGFWSCNNELDVNDDWKEVPVIYGLLNQTDTLHTVRITKAFLGEGNALFYAQIPDSSYFTNELDVRLIEFAPQGWEMRSWFLDTMWVHDKPTGDFFGGDQMLYSVNIPDLQSDHTYTIALFSNKSGKSYSANTALIGNVNITKPRGGQKFFSFTSNAETQAEITSTPNGRIYQLVIRFHYTEVHKITGDTTYKYTDWAFQNKKSTKLSGGEKIVYSFPGTGFYSHIQSALKPNPDIKRIPGSVDFIGYAGGDELSTFIDITSPFNTIVQERPEFTNVTNGGIGIFSARTSSVRTCELTPQSIDSLINGSKTIHLGFIKP